MRREAENTLLNFCLEQRRNFSPEKWLNLPGLTADEMAVVARFLSGVSWYGNREQMLGVASRLSPDSGANLSEMVKTQRFDCSRFSGLLRAKIQHE
jgi:hypothetical protein